MKLLTRILAIFLTLLAYLAPLPSLAQDEAAVRQELFNRFRSTLDFDHRYPREKVFLHFDNAAYIEGDTLYYAAYVVRASLLHPTTEMSRVLYVELLNADGSIIERNLTQLDSLGRGHGSFDLGMPIKSGFYEVRAYTREMTNWKAPLQLPPLGGGLEASAGSTRTSGEEAGYFSRVFPIFQRPKEAGDYSELTVKTPDDEDDLLDGHRRPWSFGKTSKREVDFYPEGGWIPENTEARVAFRICDGRGNPVNDTLCIYSADGNLLLSTPAEHLGMGRFVLPAAAKGAYAMVGKTRFTLPERRANACAIRVDYDEQTSVWNILLQRDADRTEEVGVGVFCREQPVWFNLCPVDRETTLLEIPDSLLRTGVNRIEVFDHQGHSLCSRLVFRPTPSPSLRGRGEVTTPINGFSEEVVSTPLPRREGSGVGLLGVVLRQNALTYEPFSPIAVQLELRDKDSLPLANVPLSISVRDDAGELIAADGLSLEAYLLLGSELRGYVHNPEYYFGDNDASRRRALDLLLMVQGWCAQPFENMCGAVEFAHPQPIEEALTICGRVIEDNEQGKPRPRARLNVTLFSDQGTYSGETRTDDKGRFVFRSNADYQGSFIGQFSVHAGNKNKAQWSRITIDQWFGPNPRKFSPQEMELRPTAPLQLPPLGGGLDASEGKSTKEAGGLLFEWEDTIPDNRRYYLKEAVVKGDKARRYRGLNFNRYTYEGGEKRGFKPMTHYINAEMELELAKDKGLEFSRAQEFLSYLLSDDVHELSYDPSEAERRSTHKTKRLYGDGSNYVDCSGDEQMNDPNLKVRPVTEGLELQDSDKPMPTEYFLYHGRKIDVVYNNYAGGVATDGFGQGAGSIATCPEDIKCVMLAKGFYDNKRYKLYQPEVMPIGTLFVYTRPNWYDFRQKKGVSKRVISGYAQPIAFPRLNYREADAPNPSDYRRTLYWNPSLTTDTNGRASAVFFSNAREVQALRVSVRGITADGRIIEYDR